MKKQLLLLAMIILPMVASADAVEINGIYYNLVTKAQVAEVTKNPNQYSGDVVIPGTVDYEGVTYNVTSIGEFAFEGSTNLTSLTMANSITTIGTYAFSYCTSLSNLVLSEGLTEIASYTFWHCESLESVVIPKNIIKIGWAAFCDCTKLKNVDLYEGLEEIGDSAFYHSNVVEANIPKSVTTIGRMAFSLCENLTSVSIPNSVTTIGSSAFGGCSSLTSVVIPESVTSIDGLFQNCTSLTSVDIPNSVTQIGSFSFQNCSSLTSVIIPSNVTSIGDWAFFGCSGLTSITIPNSVTNIGMETFKNCSSLTTVTIGSGIESIGSKAFASCLELKEVYCYAKSVPTTSNDAFLDSYVSYATLYVYKKIVAEYQAADPWKEFNIVGLPNPEHNLTYYLDDQLYKGPLSIEEEEPITPEPAPVKEGYAFSGWMGEPTVMPDHDVDVKGYFTINNYTLTYMVNDEVYKSYEVEYGAAITPEPDPEKEGYTFSGWSMIPATMPANDVTIIGSFSVNQYTITYTIDGEVYFTETVNYGTTIVPPTVPEREGYDFAWDEYPETMPAHDVTVTGTFTINKYNLTYMVDDAEYKTYEVEYGASITPEPDPEQEGYTFSGWSNIPETMPANDVTVYGTFTVNKYKLTYIIDGQTYKEYEIEYGASITPEPDPTWEGYTFSGWSDIPETMPAHDVEITGSFTQIIKADPDLAINGKGTFIAQLGFIVTLGQPYESPELFNPNGLSPIEWTSSNPNVATVDANGVLTLLSVGQTQIKATFAGNNEYEAGMAEYSLVVIDSGYMMDDNGNVTAIGGDQTGDVTIDASITINGQTYQVTAIASYAFKDNQNITSLTIPAGITTIGDNAFNGCINLLVINIGKDVQSIGNKAFANIGTAAVRTRSEDTSLIVNCYSESVPQAAWDTFENSPIETGTLYVEDDLKDSYKATSPWNKFGKILGFNEPASINSISMDSDNAIIFDIQGNRLDNVRKGVNIIRTRDGKTKKMVVK